MLGVEIYNLCGKCFRILVFTIRHLEFDNLDLAIPVNRLLYQPKSTNMISFIPFSMKPILANNLVHHAYSIQQ